MPPVAAEEGELGAGRALNFRGKRLELVLEADGSPEPHRSLAVSSIFACSFGSMASPGRSLASALSLAVGLREGTTAANNTGSNGTSVFGAVTVVRTAIRTR